MANKIEINAKNYESMKALALSNRNAGIPNVALEKAVTEYERNVENEKHAKEFAKFILNEVSARVRNNNAFGNDPLFVINAGNKKSSFGGEVLEILGGTQVQGLRYVVTMKYDRYGEFKAVALLLESDFYIKNNELWINDIYTEKNGVIPHKFVKYNGTLQDGTEVSDFRTYENFDKWEKIAVAKEQKNSKLSEIMTAKQK